MEDIKLRPAQPADAERAAALLYSAYTHTPVPYPLPESSTNSFLDQLQHFFRTDGNRFSYQYTQVAEQNADVVGLVLSFSGRDEERLNAALGWPLEREAQEDEWYVDALAVFLPWNHQGIGTRLLQAAEQQASQQRFTRVALSVAQENQHALSLYQHLHYKITGQTILYQRHYVRLVKVLEARP